MHAIGLILSTLLVFTACKPVGTVEQTSKRTGKSFGDAGPGASGGVSDAVQDDLNLTYPELYCKYHKDLRLRVDVNEEVSRWCVDGKPTQKMVDYRQAALDATPGEIKLEIIKSEAIEEEDRSEFIIAWSFHVGIRPFEVKERPIYNFVAQSYSGETVTLNSPANRQPDDLVDFGLHLWSTKMNYNVIVKATETTFLESSRNTEYNLYQVQSGNEEMGFGVETLVDPDNEDFYQSTMLNLSFNDGTGFNDGNGGTVVITVLHFSINNNGFPETAAKSIEEIAQHTANQMYLGLKD